MLVFPPLFFKRGLGGLCSGRLAATKRVHSDRNPACAEGRAEFFESAGDGAAAVRAMTVLVRRYSGISYQSRRMTAVPQAGQ